MGFGSVTLLPISVTPSNAVVVGLFGSALPMLPMSGQTLTQHFFGSTVYPLRGQHRHRAERNREKNLGAGSGRIESSRPDGAGLPGGSHPGERG